MLSPARRLARTRSERRSRRRPSRHDPHELLEVDELKPRVAVDLARRDDDVLDEPQRLAAPLERKRTEYLPGGSDGTSNFRSSRRNSRPDPSPRSAPDRGAAASTPGPASTTATGAGEQSYQRLPPNPKMDPAIPPAALIGIVNARDPGTNATASLSQHGSVATSTRSLLSMSPRTSNHPSSAETAVRTPRQREVEGVSQPDFDPRAAQPARAPDHPACGDHRGARRRSRLRRRPFRCAGRPGPGPRRSGNARCTPPPPLRSFETAARTFRRRRWWPRPRRQSPIIGKHREAEAVRDRIAARRDEATGDDHLGFLLRPSRCAALLARALRQPGSDAVSCLLVRVPGSRAPRCVVARLRDYVSDTLPPDDGAAAACSSSCPGSGSSAQPSHSTPIPPRICRPEPPSRHRR